MQSNEFNLIQIFSLHGPTILPNSSVHKKNTLLKNLLYQSGNHVLAKISN